MKRCVFHDWSTPLSDDSMGAPAASPPMQKPVPPPDSSFHAFPFDFPHHMTTSEHWRSAFPAPIALLYIAFYMRCIHIT